MNQLISQTTTRLAVLACAMLTMSEKNQASQVATTVTQENLFAKAKAEAKQQGKVCIKTAEGFETKPMLDHITHALLHPETDPFSTTDVFLFKDNTFTHLGDVAQISNSAFQDVAHGNYVYTDFYTMKKTRLSNGVYENVGAIVVGTKDENVSQKLHFASMFSMMQNHKEATAVQTSASEAAANVSASSATPSTSVTSCSSSAVEAGSNGSLSITREIERKSKCSSKLNEPMVKIKTWRNVEPFADRVVAYRAETYYFAGDAKKGNPINQDISLRYGHIDARTSRWTHNEEGFGIDRLLTAEAVPSSHALVDSELDKDNLEMRLATSDEIELMRKAIHAGTAEFEYVYDKEKADAILSKNTH